MLLHIPLIRKIKNIDEEAAYTEVMRDLSKLKIVEINIEGEGKVIMRTNLKGKAEIGYKALGMKILSKILSIIK